MKWQSRTLGVTLTVLLLARVQAAPHHIPQQLVYYNHVIPPQHRQDANVVVVPGSGAGIQQFAAAGVPLPVGGQYVLLQQPGANPVLYVMRADPEGKPDGSDEGGSGGGTYIDSIFNFISSLGIPNLSTTTTEKPGDTTEASSEKIDPVKPESDPKKPIKVVDGQGSSSSEQQSASLEKFDEDEPSPKPAAPAVPALVPAPGQRFVVIGQPQFFGNFDALRNHAVHQGLGTNGAVSSFLLLKNQQVVPLDKPQEDAGNAVSHVPGTSALEFQRYISSVREKQTQPEVANVASAPIGYQNLVYVARQPPQGRPQVSQAEDSASITVEALKARPNVVKEGEEGSEGDEDAEDIEANNPPGPSVAQVKPQAIALAGPGGVAAAAPIGTALVGPGGLAVAAPSATAVAGPSGGAPPPPGAHASAALSSPAAYKAYLLEQQAKGGYPGSYHVAYTA
ncbi:uncharacterized protein [Periplaneta americana]|uniref:uncharacterized protein n=1 Tax=Periplaneta americana TaxID=6978 RepID=UPI0037E8C59C